MIDEKTLGDLERASSENLRRIAVFCKQRANDWRGFRHNPVKAMEWEGLYWTFLDLAKYQENRGE